MKTGINLEGSAIYGRSRSALASSASCSNEVMSVGLNKISVSPRSDFPSFVYRLASGFNGTLCVRLMACATGRRN